MKFRFHCLGLPHTVTNSEYISCAYTQKVLKFLRMMSRRGHTCIHYGNEGSVLPDGVEHVQLFTEKERAGFFKSHDKSKQYQITWDWSQPYWQAYSERARPELASRCNKGDFICLITAPRLYQTAIDQFQGAYNGVCRGPMAVEYGIGYYGPQSMYRCYESSSHREFCHGMSNNRVENNFDAVIPNYFDLDEFDLNKLSAKPSGRLLKLTETPYYLFIGRLNRDKGYLVAIETTRDIRARLIMAGTVQDEGSFNPNGLPSHVTYYGPADVNERAWLMSHCIATLAPTHFREPFCGVSVESQLCGRPCITTDHGAFVENIESRWRCASHQEFVNAALLAKKLTTQDQALIKKTAESRWSLEAVAPLYERYFSRLYRLWGAGWYETRPLEEILI